MNNITISIIALALVFGGFTLLSSKTGEQSTQQASIIGALENIEDTVETDEVIEKEKESEIMKKEDKEVMEKEVMEKHEDEVMVKEENVVKKEETDMIKGEEVMVKEETMMKKEPGVYADYSVNKVAEAKGDIILFFYAAWCPSCRTLDSDIQASLGDIPDGVTILKLDYDSETELKKRYGVRSQHTMVQVDNTGEKIQLWSGGNTLESIVSKI